MKKIFILRFKQLKTGENVGSFAGGLGAPHGAADLYVTNKELIFVFLCC